LFSFPLGFGRNPESEVIGFEKNKIHHQVAILNHKENNLENLKFN
jgi:hypothetical protein